jgi:5-methyltetrahydropteroyltriglutamate--homocysteine methyltransferase
MKRSTNRILTTHVGSLSRPADLIEMYRDQAPEEKLESRLTSAVAEVVRQQVEARRRRRQRRGIWKAGVR